MAKNKQAAAAGSASCPCGAGMDYAECCGRYVDDFVNTPAPDAERLMRSRYTAFVRAREPYLLATWHASTRPADVAMDPQCQWLGLAVKECLQTTPHQAEVEFVARYKVQGRAVRMHERSRFVQEQGRWFYVDGDQF